MEPSASAFNPPQSTGPQMVWNAARFLIRCTTTFPRQLLYRNTGERVSSPLLMALSAMFWSVLIALPLFHARGPFELGQRTLSPSLDRATLTLFFNLCLFACVHQALDWWRRDLTHGSYILSKFIGEPRLPVTYFESALLWIVPAALCGRAGAHAAEACFLLVMFCSLAEWAEIRLRERRGLLAQRDAHLLGEIMAGREREIVGLKETMRLAGVTEASALRSRYDNL